MSDLWLQLADWTVKATLIVVLAGVAARMMPGRPKLRRMVWVASLACVFLLPVSGAFSRKEQALIRIEAPAATMPATAYDGVSVPWPVQLWLLGAGVSLLAFSAGYVALSRLASHSRLLMVDLPKLPEAGLRRKWRLKIAVGPSPAAAVTYGVFRPVVLLPADAETWAEEEMRAVLLHELGHVRSLDSLVQLLMHLACSVFWFNPAIWVAAKALRAECEANADEAVMEAGIRPSDYAAMLLAFASGLAGTRPHRLALSIVRQPGIERRIRTIVRSSPQHSRPRSILSRLIGGLFVVGLTLALGTIRLAEAQSPRPVHSADWERGYKLAQEYVAKHRTPPSDYTPPLTAEQRRNIELSLRNRASPP